MHQPNSGYKVPGEKATFLSANRVEAAETGEVGPQYPVEMLNTLTAVSVLPDHKHILKIGLSVMLLCSSDRSRVHENGS